MSTEIINEINNVSAPEVVAEKKKKVYVKKAKSVETKKIIVETDAEEEGKEIILTNPVNVETQVVDLFAEAQKEYEETHPEETEEKLKRIEARTSQIAALKKEEEDDNIQQEDALQEVLVARMETDLAAAETEDELTAMLREQKELALKIQNYEKSKAVKRNADGYREILLRNRQDKAIKIKSQMEKLAAELAKTEGETEALRGFDNDELTTIIMGDLTLQIECGFIPNAEPYVPVFERPATKKAAAPKTKTEGAPTTKVMIDRKKSWSLIPTNAILKATYKKEEWFVRKNSKGGLTEVFDINDPRKRTKDDKEFPDITNANKYFCEDKTGQVRSGNAWALFKAWNKETRKTESLEGINNKNVYDCADVAKYLW